MPVYFAYYAGIMLDAFGYPLCFLLCWHNRSGPNKVFQNSMSQHNMTNCDKLKLVNCSQ